MFNRSSSILLIILIVALSPGLLHADSQQAHEHGSAVLNMVLEGNELSIQFLSPAMNIVNFEHEVKIPAEKTIVEQAVATLKKPTNIVILSGAAACVVSKVGVDSSLSASEHVKHEEHEESHSDFDVSYEFVCSNPQALTEIQAVAFNSFKGLEDIDVRFISEAGQRSGEMSRKNNSFLLK